MLIQSQQNDAPRRSRWGVEQATGNLWIWGADTQGNAGGGWAAITDGRGSVYNSGVTAVLLAPTGAAPGTPVLGRRPGTDLAEHSGGDVSARGLSDHLILFAER